MEQLISALEERGYAVKLAATRQQARELLLEELRDAETVGIGGSMTIRQLDLAEQLQKDGKTVFWHWLPEKPGVDARKEALFSDVYLASANAVTEDGKLLFIDGSGNRVAAVCFGPKRVILVIGRNKLAADEQSAERRIRDVACPPNARRLGLQTPCAVTGACASCASPQRFCNAFLKLERCPGSHPVLIVLTDEELGY